MNKKILMPLIFLLLTSCEKTFDSEILKFYGDSFENIGYSVAKGPNGYLIAGQYTRIDRTPEGIKGSLKKLAVVETDNNGKLIRLDTTSEVQPSVGNKIISSDDGSFVVAGYSTDSQGQTDIYVAKFAPGGEGSKGHVFEFVGNQTANDIIKTPEGYLVLGTTDKERYDTQDRGNTKGKKDVILLRIDNDLNQIGSDPIGQGFTGNDEGISVKASDKGYIIVGTTDRYKSTTGTDIFVLPINPDFSTTKFQILEKSGNQVAADFEVVSEGIFIAGTTYSESGTHGYACRIEGDLQAPVLNITSENEISFGEEPTVINAICPYKTNSFIMAGQYGSASSGSMLIFATDMFGFPVEGKSKIAGGTGNQAVHDVITDGDDIIVAGRNSYENSSMITLLKFRF